MSGVVKVSLIIGVILTLVGSFLPWRREGDFISYWTCGIQIYPTIKDNGGFLIVLLTMIVTMMTFGSFAKMEKSLLWSIPPGIILVFDSIYHIYQLFISRANAGRVIGEPVIQMGLVMVLIGSMLLLFSTVTKYFRLSV